MGLLIAMLLTGGCVGTPQSAGPRPGPEARRVADTFVQHTLAGDSERASDYTVDAGETWTLREFARDSLNYGLHIAGPVKGEGNLFKYPLRGEYSIPKSMGGGSEPFEASLRVWMTFTSDGWLVSDWIYRKTS